MLANFLNTWQSFVGHLCWTTHVGQHLLVVCPPIQFLTLALYKFIYLLTYLLTLVLIKFREHIKTVLSHGLFCKHQFMYVAKDMIKKKKEISIKEHMRMVVLFVCFRGIYTLILRNSVLASGQIQHIWSGSSGRRKLITVYTRV